MLSLQIIGSLCLSPGPLSLADCDRERGGGGSGESAVSLTAEPNIREIINYCDKIKHISTIFAHLFSVLFALSAASSRSRRLCVMRVGEAAVWLAAAAIS